MIAPARHESKQRLLAAAVRKVREKGYAATRIEDVCAEAGVTKGSFFHHFESKEDLALAAAAYWDEMAAQAFAATPWREAADPAQRLLAYLDLRKAMLAGDVPNFTCFNGAIVQEAYRTQPAVSGVCARSILDHAKTFEDDIREAMAARGLTGFSPQSLALHMQAVLQGAFIIAKAAGGAGPARDSIDHLRRYMETLFEQTPKRKTGRAAPKKKPVKQQRRNP